MTLAPFTMLAGRAVPLMLSNVDTDVIIRVDRMTSTDPQVLAPWAFEPLRYRAGPGEVFDDRRYAGAPILVTGDNFGCGSSREPAVWAIMGLGFRCVIAPSFGDIFRANCLTNGVLPVALDRSAVEKLADAARQRDEVTVDLPAQQVKAASRSWPFEIGAVHKLMLMEGLDELTLSLRRADEVSDWEADDQQRRRWAWAPARGWTGPTNADIRRGILE
jgi:3-isopropylmalate/(R)-2-methylmalate dehydratase small subunit